MNKYRQLLHTIAQNPGLTAEELAAESNTHDEVEEPLARAVEANDVVEVNDRYWIVRKGEFAYEKYDHSVTGSV